MRVLILALIILIALPAQAANFVERTINFHCDIVLGSQVAIEDLGHGVQEVLVSAYNLHERYITSQPLTYFRLDYERFTIEPSGIAVATR